jgi:glycine C-acetyltransferase/8-amino-7-oxononanoate synthase
MVDEAHATGTYGPGGRGTVAEAGREEEGDVIVGTLGKSLGAYGAYACCDKTMAKYLINSARSLIFSTALPPPVASAAMAALDLLRSEPRLVDRVRRNGQLLRESLSERGVRCGPSETHILPLVIGGAEDTLKASQAALERGIFAQAIRPPTVPSGTSRLRLTVMATHTKAELALAARVLADVAKPLIRLRPVEDVRTTGVFDGLSEAA